MNIPPQFRRVILGVALALAALAPAVLSASAAAAAPTLGSIQIRSAGTSAVVAFTSSEPVAVTITHQPKAPANGQPVVQAWNIFTTTHETRFTDLTSNTSYDVTVTARTSDNRTATAETSFTTAKKRVRITLQSIDITDDGDLFGDGEPLWFVKPIWDGANFTNGRYGGALCYPASFGTCEHGTFGEGRFTPLNLNYNRALQIIFPEENFDRFPSVVALEVWAKEDDAIGGASVIECFTNPGCPVGDDAELREWRVPQGVEFAEETITLRGNDSGTGFASVLTFRFELVHVHAPYPVPYRNIPTNTFFTG